MHAGHYISGTAHLALLGWMAFGDVFAAEPLPLETVDVAVISSAEFDAMTAMQPAPQSVTEVAQPAVPEAVVEAPDVPAPDQQTEIEQPEATQTPDAETPPDVSQIAPLPPPVDLSDQAPVLEQPPADIAVLVPEVADTPVPQAAERVAPEAVAPPDPEAIPDEVEQEAASPDATGDTVEEPAEATAPEAAATEIVTEAEKPARAPETSLRPPARRPEAPVQTAQPAPETDDAVQTAVDEAVAAAQSEPAIPQGPPLTGGEKSNLISQISRYWNVGALSTDALATVVVVAFSVSRDGKPVNASIRLVSSSGGSEAATRQAFETARRAIIRSGTQGFDLPAEKYGQWREIEITFNPERMRVK